MKSIRWLLAGIVCLAAAILVWYATRSSPAPSDESEDGAGSLAQQEIALPVRVSRAWRGTLTKSLTTNGTLRARREVDLVARVGGEVVGVYAHNGKHVRKGDVLVRIDDREYRLAFEKASAALLAAQIEYRTQTASEFLTAPDSARVREELGRARARWQEAIRAHKEGRLDDAALARARREYDATVAYLSVDRGDIIANKSGLAAAQEAYTRAKMDVEATELRAPFDGVVGNLELIPGRHITSGTVVCTVVDLSTLLVDVDVIESEAPRVHPGQRAELTVVALADKSFTGKVLTRNPMIDPKTKTLRVTIEVTNLPAFHSLMPGMYATVKIQTESYAHRTLVPKAALLVRDQRPLVFVAQAGLAKWHYVEIGEENDEVVEIRSGIAAGDTVIVDGHYTLAHDAKIRVVARDSRPAAREHR
ncbi:MAG: hypothetical protein C4326_15060 [Ignavibacteria bacterium]